MRDYDKLIRRQQNKKEFVPPPLIENAKHSSIPWVPLVSAIAVLVLYFYYS